MFGASAQDVTDHTPANLGGTEILFRLPENSSALVAAEHARRQALAGALAVSANAR